MSASTLRPGNAPATDVSMPDARLSRARALPNGPTALDHATGMYQLAQLNLAAMKAPLNDPMMAEFTASLGRINGLADAHPGFVWRLQDEGGDATAIRLFGERILVNMSVWRDVASLRDFTFRSAHTEFLKRRREWFDRMSGIHAVLWWVSSGHRPSLSEAAERLAELRDRGPSHRAFTFTDAESTPHSVHVTRRW